MWKLMLVILMGMNDGGVAISEVSKYMSVRDCYAAADIVRADFARQQVRGPSAWVFCVPL